MNLILVGSWVMTRAAAEYMVAQQRRQAPTLAPTSVNEAERTVEVVASTFATVARRGYRPDGSYGPWFEGLDPAGCSLARMIGAPVLRDHWASTYDQIGGVASARIDGGRLLATPKFSATEAVEPLWSDIRAGLRRQWSIGYAVQRYERQAGDADAPPTFIARAWTPYELSLVAIGADPGATTRAAEDVNPCVVTHAERTAAMADNIAEQIEEEQRRQAAGATTGANGGGAQPGAGTDANRAQQPAGGASGGAAAPPTAPTAPTGPAGNVVSNEQRAAIQADERRRIGEIERLGRTGHFTVDEIRAAIEGNVSVEAFRNQALDRLVERSPQMTNHISIVADEVDKRRTFMANALLHRHDGGAYKLEDGARQWRGMTLMEMGRAALEAAGVRTQGMERHELAGEILGMRSGGMMSTSDFPLILADVANKTLRRAYSVAPQTFRKWARKVSASDFKAINRLQLGDAPAFEKVGEAGEFKRGSITEAKESYKLNTFGKIVSLSRQVIINDDVGAFTRVPSAMGKAAAELESLIVYGELTGARSMEDGKPLFDADHHNIGGAGLIGVPTLSEGRMLMRRQKAPGGARALNTTAAFLIVPSTLETAAQQFTSVAYIAAKNADINPFAGKLEPIVEPLLDDVSPQEFYLAADPAGIDTVEYCYLAGQEGAYLEWRVGFDVDGMELKGRLDFAAAAVDWRGLVKMPGAAPG